MARQCAKLRAEIGKAARTPEEQDAIDRVLAGVDFAGWSVLVGDIDEDIAAIVEDAGYAALLEVGIDIKAEPAPAGIVSDYAVKYADSRAAELVGMRYDELGELVENPRAEWAITESTRDFLRGAVTDAIEGGKSNDWLARTIADSYGFSRDRADMIARTETNIAQNKGSLQGYKASGLVTFKQWVTADDDLVEPECEANGLAGAGGDGVIPIDDDFPSGDDAPPAHPNCRCVIVPVVVTQTEEEPA